jgi:hypothetical protein
VDLAKLDPTARRVHHPRNKLLVRLVLIALLLLFCQPLAPPAHFALARVFRLCLAHALLDRIARPGRHLRHSTFARLVPIAPLASRILLCARSAIFAPPRVCRRLPNAQLVLSAAPVV